MADIEGNFHCCSDCAMFIANDDTSGLDLYGAAWRLAWENAVAFAAANLPERGVPVVECPARDEVREFLCDHCERDVLSLKYRLTFSA